MEHHGTEFKTRFKKIGRASMCHEGDLDQDVAEFHGDDAESFHPILALASGRSSHTLPCSWAARAPIPCNVWWTTARRGSAQSQSRVVTKGMAELKDRAAKAGRETQTSLHPASGLPVTWKLVDNYQATGATCVILRLPF